MVTKRKDVNEDMEMSEKVKEKKKMGGWSGGGKGSSKRNKATKNVNVESSTVSGLCQFKSNLNQIVTYVIIST